MRFANLRSSIVPFALLFVAIVVSSVLFYRASTQVVANQQSVKHTNDVLDELDSLTTSFLEAQNSVFDFALTKNSQDQDVYHQASSAIDLQIGLLRQITSDNPIQQTLVGNVETQTAQLKQSLEAGLTAPQRISPASSPQLQLQGILTEISHMREEELSLLDIRSHNAERSIVTMRQGIIVATIANALLLLLVAFAVISALKQQADAAESRSRLSAIVDSSQDAVIGKTLEGTITSWNAAAEDLYGYSAAEAIGKPIYMIVPPEVAPQMKAIFDSLERGERVAHLETTRVKKDGTKVDMDLTISPIRNAKGRLVGASAIGRDITKRKRQEESIRELSSRILQSQDEERRRIARELHDTTVQKLALISMSLSQMHDAFGISEQDPTFKTCRDLTAECLQELRTLSYLLHPPMLDELGLPSALRIYGEGFSKRSGIMVNVDTPSSWTRLSPDIEMSLFRVAQESLTNVLRHSGSSSADIRLFQNGETKLEISDSGRGMKHSPQDSNFPISVGVGIAGMRERLRQFGGSLHLESSHRGTTVRVVLPHPEKLNGKDTNSYRG